MKNVAWLTVKQAAEISQVKPYTMREWCKKGKVKGAKKIGRDWRIPDYFMAEAKGVTVEPVKEVEKVAPVTDFRSLVKSISAR